MSDNFNSTVSQLGTELKQKLTVHVVTGDPEEQLRTPIDHFLRSVATALNIKDVNVIGEVKMADIASRPDFAVTVGGALCGFVEVKALGKGADPRQYHGHDKDQFERLRLLPNVLYTDAQNWSLWQNGERIGQVESLDGNVESEGVALAAPVQLESMLSSFLEWTPISPRTAAELARASARLCRLLRAEVVYELGRGVKSLKTAAEEWRHLLFPGFTDEQFADGYAQAITFGFLIARAKNIPLNQDTDQIGKSLGVSSSLIGRSLQMLGNAADTDADLTAVIDTAKRVLGVVDWPTLEKNRREETWLYFYEDFLSAYDNKLRKKTGSYYTPPQVVKAMTSLTDEAVSSLIGLDGGISNPAVTLLDPAMGTGTFLLEALRLVADRYESDYGDGNIGAAVAEKLKKIIGFEIQLGPYAVAQLRILAELTAFGADATADDLRTYVADTLSDPNQELAPIGAWYEPISESRRMADQIKREEHVLVVLGNPPYKEKAKGLGGWIESGSNAEFVPYNDYLPPKSWGLGPHTKNLRNLYVYFWRWATWKVFDSVPHDKPGVVALITAAGFLDGDGFQRMRAKMREQATDIFVIRCSPEGFRPPVRTRIFEAVPHEVCIVIAVRSRGGGNTPATVKVRSLAPANRSSKFSELATIRLDDEGWALAPTDPRAPFALPAHPEWGKHPSLTDIFLYDGSGVMPGRSWTIAPDSDTLVARAQTLQRATSIARKRELFSEGAGLRVDRTLKDALPGYKRRGTPVGDDDGVEEPTRYAFRSLDQQWIIPDKRVLNRPNPTLWSSLSSNQVYVTAPKVGVPREGPAVTVSGAPPDMDHYAGRGGRVFPSWTDKKAVETNVRGSVIDAIADAHSVAHTGDQVVAYLVGIASHPGYVASFAAYLDASGIRIPFTADPELFEAAVELGNKSIFYQTYGSRMKDHTLFKSSLGRPRMAPDRAPRTTADAPIPITLHDYPNSLTYDESSCRLYVGSGAIENVTLAMREYSIDGVNVLDQWFSYRKADRSRPQIGNRRISDLLKIRPDHWLPEYTSDLVDLLNVIGLLIELQPLQESLLTQIMSGDFIEGLAGTSTEGATTSSAQATRASAAEAHGQTALDIPVE